MRIRDCWQIIHDWLNANQPSMQSLLNPPAQLPEIRGLEEKIGHRFPDEFIESYLIHNGSDDCSGVFVGLDLLSLDAIERIWRGWIKVLELPFHEMLSQAYSSFPNRYVKRVYANRNWISFVGGESNHVAIDFDPDSEGTVGQVINCGRDDQVRYVIAKSFGGFMTFITKLFANECVTVFHDPCYTKPRWLKIKGTDDDLLTGLPLLLENSNHDE